MLEPAISAYDIKFLSHNIAFDQLPDPPNGAVLPDDNRRLIASTGRLCRCRSVFPSMKSNVKDSRPGFPFRIRPWRHLHWRGNHAQTRDIFQDLGSCKSAVHNFVGCDVYVANRPRSLKPTPVQFRKSSGCCGNINTYLRVSHLTLGFERAVGSFRVRQLGVRVSVRFLVAVYALL